MSTKEKIAGKNNKRERADGARSAKKNAKKKKTPDDVSVVYIVYDCLNEFVAGTGGYESYDEPFDGDDYSDDEERQEPKSDCQRLTVGVFSSLKDANQCAINQVNGTNRDFLDEEEPKQKEYLSGKKIFDWNNEEYSEERFYYRVWVERHTVTSAATAAGSSSPSPSNKKMKAIPSRSNKNVYIAYHAKAEYRKEGNEFEYNRKLLGVHSTLLDANTLARKYVNTKFAKDFWLCKLDSVESDKDTEFLWENKDFDADIFDQIWVETQKVES
jgi:hypothetical protein